MSRTTSRCHRLLLQRPSRSLALPRSAPHRSFHASSPALVVKPFLLADIGEGITECQLIQWFVQPGARVEQFDKLCEVQSDKASVEITSPFDGVIKKLYYDPDDMALTGKPLVDIDIQGEVGEEEQALLGGSPVQSETKEAEQKPEPDAADKNAQDSTPKSEKDDREQTESQTSSSTESKHRSLATPAVRHLTRELRVDILEIVGTGKDGRVLKEDVHRYAAERDGQEKSSGASATTQAQDRTVALTPVQTQMFKTMTKSLQIPHFLYSCAADMTAITTIRSSLNATAAPDQKLTHLAFIIKAVSLAFAKHPILNAALNTKDDKKPELTYRSGHNFGVAIDTPSGLLVPVIHNVQDLSIAAIASKMRQLSAAARLGKLTPGDFKGASFTISNIGSVGGGVVAPVISQPQVAILGVGRSKVVPAFDDRGELVKREDLVLSWSADHRVVDGAECARCAERVKTLLEQPASMIVDMR